MENFGVKGVHVQPVTEADRLNGTDKRYLVAFSCAAHRTRDRKKNTWGVWYPIGNVLFPSALIFEMKGGTLVTAPSERLDKFIPGPGPAITVPKTNASSPDLPPGMSRAK